MLLRKGEDSGSRVSLTRYMFDEEKVEVKKRGTGSGGGKQAATATLRGGAAAAAKAQHRGGSEAKDESQLILGDAVRGNSDKSCAFLLK